MRLSITNITLAFLLSASAIAQAAKENIPSNRKVTKVSNYGDAAVVYFIPSHTNNQNCPSSSPSAVKIDTTNEKGMLMLSGLLSAADSGKAIGFGIEGCSGLPLVYRVDVAY